jgi:hypothetical protein
MRTSTAAACCALAVLLAALPGMSAASDTLEVASGSGRQLLVVNDNVTSTAAVTVSSCVIALSGYCLNWHACS